MLTELSPGQEAALQAHADKWVQIGLNTDPIDRPKAMAAVELAYECAGLKVPAQFVWCQSPLAVDLAYRMVGDTQVGRKLDFNSRELLAVVSHAVLKKADRIRDVVYERIRDVWDGIRYAIDEREGTPEIRDSVWAGIGDSLWESGLGSELDIGLLRWQDSSAWRYGQLAASAVSLHSFFREECGLVAETSKLPGLLATAQECGWLIPCESMVFISSKPIKIDLDAKLVVYGDGLECKASPRI